MSKLKVGDTVTLNDYGLEVIFGSTFGLGHMKSLRMKITEVDPVSVTQPELTYPVSVDNPEIDQYLIFDACFDLVEEPKTDPCPGCRPGVVCRTPNCGRLKDRPNRVSMF